MTIEDSIQQGKTPRYAWAILAVTYLACVAAPFCQFKIPPLSNEIIPMLIGNFGVDPANVGVYFGMLMTCLTIIGAVLAFPAAFLARKISLKATVLISDACMAIGGVMCALWGTESLAILYASRILEGVGIGLVGVAGPTCVSIWFPEQTRGRALGIWATWVPVGCVLSFGIVPYISQAAGFVAVFWMTAIISAVAFVLFALVFKMPPTGSASAADAAKPAEAVPSVRESLGFLKNKWIWMLGIVFFCFTFNTLGIVNSYYNTYLTLGGWDAAVASNVTSICTGVGIITAPLAGVIFDKLKREHKRYLVAFVMLIIMVSVFFMWDSAGTGNPQIGVQMTSMSWFALVMFVGLQSICGGMGGGSVRPFAPMLVEQNAVAASMAMAVLQFMQNLGSGLGSLIYGSLIDMTDISTWALPGNLLQLPICAVAIVIVLCINPWKRSKKQRNNESQVADEQLEENAN